MTSAKNTSYIPSATPNERPFQQLGNNESTVTSDLWDMQRLGTVLSLFYSLFSIKYGELKDPAKLPHQRGPDVYANGRRSRGLIRLLFICSAYTSGFKLPVRCFLISGGFEMAVVVVLVTGIDLRFLLG